MSDISIKTIISTIRDLYPFTDELLISKNFDEPLTGRLFGFSKVELVYLFFELEKKLGFSFEEQKLNDYGFSSINRIANVIDQSIEQSIEVP